MILTKKLKNKSYEIDQNIVDVGDMAVTFNFYTSKQIFIKKIPFFPDVLHYKSLKNSCFYFGRCAHQQPHYMFTQAPKFIAICSKKNS